MVETTAEDETSIFPPNVPQPDISESAMPLKQLLEAAMCRSFNLNGNASKEFLPEPNIGRILTTESVRNALQTSCLGMPNFMCGIYASAIFSQKKTYTKIFAILVLIGRVDALPGFIQNSLGDEQLPLAFTSPPVEKTTTLVRSTTTPSCFDLSLVGFSHYETLLFEETQWKFLAPVFARRDLDGEPRQFPAGTVLPFVMPGSSDGVRTLRNGPSNNSHIYHAHVHDGHHDFPVSGVAVKELLHAGSEDYRREVEALKTFGGRDQPHVIELLATFKRGKTYYLVFPWAETDLHGLFAGQPSSMPCDTGSTTKVTTFTAKQMLGVAEALKAIHYCRLKKRPNKECHESPVRTVRGYHGDIKPENILVENGQWKLADFGLSRIGSGTDHSLGDRPAGCSPTYRAPEHDVGAFDGQKADIWSLGCVMSVAATWMTLGRKGVKTFSANRQTKADGRLDNSFFEVSKDQAKGTRIKLKDAVSHWISRLRRAPTASTFTRDLLDLIRDEMLEVDGSKRITSADVVSRLEKMYEKCADDPGYTKPGPCGGMSSWNCRSALLRGSSPHEARSLSVNMVQIPSPKRQNRTLQTVQPPLAPWSPCYSTTGFGDWVDATSGVPSSSSLSESFPPVQAHYDSSMNQPVHVFGDMALLASRDKGELTSPNIEENLPAFENSSTSRLTVPQSTREKKRRRGPTSEQAGRKRQRSQKPLTWSAASSPGAAESCSESPTSAQRVERLFACPYFKYNPVKYGVKEWNSCGGLGWEIPRLKEHLRRKHYAAGYRCSRCLQRLPTATELNDHYKAKVPCLSRNDVVDDKMDDAQLSSCQAQMRGMPGAYKWGEIYKILFGSTSPEEIPSPYRDELERFREFLESQKQHGIYDNVQLEIDICLKWVHEFQNPMSFTQSSTYLSEAPSMTGGWSNDSTLSFDAISTQVEAERVQYEYNRATDFNCQGQQI
ncbi:protein kinase [Colletotrichum orchidophilum]|uniref:Protein kinase n=1 Tax=Colletotrichum orchidophilum TaxID=1209926 RepID=A0A1G4ATN4_9PEZI|nr:protein kinase [Colletotrichum orchidophilum]OHE92465.1 protein kinase [Colletotrichum orchidophilum]